MRLFAWALWPLLKLERKLARRSAGKQGRGGARQRHDVTTPSTILKYAFGLKITSRPSHPAVHSCAALFSVIASRVPPCVLHSAAPETCVAAEASRSSVMVPLVALIGVG